jgi:ATP synthase protein I
VTGPQDVLAVLVRRALVPLVLAGAAASAVGLLVGAREGAGAGLGAVLVVVVFSGTLLLMRLTADMAPQLALGVALLAYWVKVSLLAMLLLAAHSLRWFDPWWFAGTVVAGTLLWCVLHVRAVAGARVLVFGSGGALDGRST